MAFRSRRRFGRTRARRAFRRRRFARRRMVRSRMYRSTRVRSSFKAQGLPRELAVKFPFYSRGQLGGDGVFFNRFVILGNSLDPIPQVLQGPIGSPPSSDQIQVGDWLVPGHEEYSRFYGTSIVTGSGWKIQITNPFEARVRVVVLVCPYQVGRLGGTDTGSLIERIGELDALHFRDLCSQPYARMYELGESLSGQASKFFKVYRRTATMIGVKDLKDRITIAGEDLPLVAGDQLPVEGWFIYMRSEGVITDAVNVVVRGMIYAHLTNRAPLGLDAATIGPDQVQEPDEEPDTDP